MTKYRCKNCGYIYTDEDDYNFLTNCIMCEGPNEKKIMDILMENGKLKFSEDDLLGLTIYHGI